MGKRVDLTGEKFSRLTVVGYAGNDKSGSSTWLCRCNCEEKTEKIVSAKDLKSGGTKSCRCLNRESASLRNVESDLTGQPFGRWFVLQPCGFNSQRQRLYECQCSCKKKTVKIVIGSDLKNGKSKSCGCLSRELTKERNNTPEAKGHLARISALSPSQDSIAKMLATRRANRQKPAPWDTARA